MEYVIISRDDTLALMDSVNEKLDEGYMLQGGISVICSPNTRIGNSYRYYQAMTKN